MHFYHYFDHGKHHTIWLPIATIISLDIPFPKRRLEPGEVSQCAAINHGELYDQITNFIFLIEVSLSYNKSWDRYPYRLFYFHMYVYG